jgi:predicted dehydrogenase
MALKAVLVGCGAMSQTWLDAVAQVDGLEIVGLADLDPARVRAVAERHGLRDAVQASDVAELLARTRPDLAFDLVVPQARHAVVSAALAAGCHVLSEKPMAETLEQAKDLIVRARGAGKLHVVVQNRRYLDSVRRIARALAEGLVGQLTSVHADFFLAPHFGGFREDMAHVLLVDMAIHAFDAARCMTGGKARSVYCQEWNPPGSWYREGSSAAAIFEMDDGVVFNYRGSWCAAGLGTSWECAWRFVGTRGTLVWDGDAGLRAEVALAPRTGLFDATRQVEIPVAEGRVGGHLGVLRDFVDAVRGSRVPETAGPDNIHSLAMTLGAVDSVRSGRRVEIVI